jgi:hypothetical protein
VEQYHGKFTVTYVTYLGGAETQATVFDLAEPDSFSKMTHEEAGWRLWYLRNEKIDPVDALRLQLGGYARDLLCYGVPRSHALCTMLDDCFIRLVLYDHSLIVESVVSCQHVITSRWALLRFLSLSRTTSCLRCYSAPTGP